MQYILWYTGKNSSFPHVRIGIPSYCIETPFSSSVFRRCIEEVQHIGYYSLIAYLLGFQRRGGAA